MSEHKQVANLRKEQDVHAAITQQMRQEFGDQTPTIPQLSMLQQKYGIIAPQLTEMEKNLILRTERAADRKAA